MANLLASSSTSSGAYDVFINHRGPDTKLSIASHLYSRLSPLGLRVFLDKEELEKGVFFTSQIAAAIRAAFVHIAIFSPRYAESEWCLNELLLMSESMESGRSIIIPIFYGVKPADLRWKLGRDGAYAKALTRFLMKKTIDSQTHREKPCYDCGHIEKWRNALFNVSHISGFDLDGAYNGVEWQLVNEVVELVLEKVKKPPLYVSKYPTGLDVKVKDFEELVQQQSSGTRVVGIVGLGGVGKTTLAKEIFNRVRSNYKRSCFLFDVREKSVNFLNSLQSVLIKDLTQLNVQISSIDEGQEKIRRCLLSCHSLIVLDDVDDIEQLDALLLPAMDVLDTNSLILVTTRNKDVLISLDIPESSIYRLTGLNPQHSQELFCLHAFGQPHPDVGFDKVVKEFLDSCHGLPLYLKVLGALLRGKRDLNHWKMQLRKISKILPDDIQRRLKISYDSLDEEEKQIFLDIACFFIGEDMDTAIRIWDESGWEGCFGLRNLEDKCLVEVDGNNCLRMHEVLRDLGRHIGRKEPPDRLWRLTGNLVHDLPDKSTVRGINMVETPVENLTELGNRFVGMHGLKLVRAEGDCLEESIFRSVQSQHIIWLRWDMCPYSCLPSWIPMERLKVLQVGKSKNLNTLWEDHNLQVPLQLRELNIIDSGLLEIPKSIGKLKHLEKFALTSQFSIDLKTLPEEFCHLQSLKHLRLIGCSSMKSLPDSFGNLTKLQHIDLVCSRQLKMLPNTFGNLGNLQQINLHLCCELEKLPDSWGNLSNLQQINLSNCYKLESLPDSFGELKNIQQINFSFCSGLKRLSDSFGELKNLQHINLSSCSELERLPDSFGALKNLQHINLFSCSKLERLPESFGELKNLQHIDLSLCSKLKRLPNSFCNLIHLKHLNLNYCSELNIFPETFGKISTLECLYISGCPKIEVCPPQVAQNRLLLTLFLVLTNLKELPSNIEELSNLQVLHLGSEWLEMLPPSLGHLRGLRELVLSNCLQLKYLPDNISSLRSLQELVLSKCERLKCLPDHIGELRSLHKLELSGCKKLKCLPDSIRLLTQLRELKIKKSAVEHLPPSVMELNCLEQLEIEDCPLSGLPFRKVQWGIVLNKLDASVVKCMLRLKYIKLFCIGISEVSFSEGVCPNLQHLDIYRCGFLTEVEALPTTLTKLTLSKCCALRKIGGLCGLQKLEKFKLVGCSNVYELPGLETLICLDELIINCSNLRSIEVLVRLTGLGVLNVANCCELKEIPGLEYLKLLRKLTASGCQKLQSIEGLAQLTELEVLNVANCCELKELPGLKYLKSLKKLNASGCRKLQSIQGLAQLTRLEMLNVANCCELKEIPDLQYLKLLEKLNASGCRKLQSIHGLAQLTGLETLNVANCCELKEIPGLQHLKLLEELNASGCGNLQSIDGLAQLTALQVLNVEDCFELKEIPGLKHLKLLRNLNASGCGKLQSIEGLVQLTGLGVLNVANWCELKEIPGIQQLKLLEELNASGCGKLRSIEGLSQLAGLEVLNLANCCELKEIPGLQHLKLLEELNASGCGKLQSIEGLEQLAGLQVLNLQDCCELREIPGLQHLKLLRKLNVSGCEKLQSIEGLEQMTGLAGLNVANC